jgi:putative protein-disulfide isomerase
MDKYRHMIQIYYILDPMCSWCWGFRETFLAFQQKISAARPVDWHYLMGGLARDSGDPMPDEMCRYVQGQWHAVSERCGVTFNYDFWTSCQPRRSTWPACRAVIAAGQQGDDHKVAMIEAIQRAYYIEARNPSDLDTLCALAAEIGLNASQFLSDIESEKTADLLRRDRDACRTFSVSSFPTLIAVIEGQQRVLCAGYSDLSELMERWELANTPLANSGPVIRVD